MCSSAIPIPTVQLHSRHHGNIQMVLTACSHLPPQLAGASFINLRRVKSSKLMAFRSCHDYQLLSDAQIIIFKLSVC